MSPAGTFEEEHQSPPEKKPKHEEERPSLMLDGGETGQKKPMLEGGSSEQNLIIIGGGDTGDESSDEEEFEGECPGDYLKYYENKFPESLMNKIRSKPEYNPDSDYIPLGSSEVDWNVWREYSKQIEETQGFGVKIFPGTCFLANLRPIPAFKEHQGFYNMMIELADLAIKQFNRDNNDKEFKVVDIEWVVERPSRDIMYFLTFTAEDPQEGVKTFEAKVLHGLRDEREVELCRIKN